MKLITPVFKLFACTLCRAKRGACRKARGLRSSLPLKVSFWLKIWMVVHFPNHNWGDWSSDATDGICRASVNAERSESQQASPQPPRPLQPLHCSSLQLWVFVDDFYLPAFFFIKIWVLYLSYSLYKKWMVGAMNISYFLISFSIKDCSYVRINSILKVMCIFSRRELFIIPSVQKPAAQAE